MQTLDNRLKEIIQNDLYGEVNSQSITRILKDLDNLPVQINLAGLSLDKTMKDIMEVQLQLKEAEQSLKIAEGTALAFPDRELKNEAQRKAYAAERTQEQQKLVLDLQKKKIELEISKVDIQTRYNKLQDSFAATKHKATVITSLLQFLSR